MKKTYLLAGLGIGIVALSAAGAVYAANGNYAAWRAAMGGRGGRATEVVTEKNFDQFTEMHRLMAEGNYTEAQAVRTDLGLGQGQGRGNGGGCGMNKGGGCAMRNGGGRDANFVDANNNKICDHMEQPAK